MQTFAKINREPSLLLLLPHACTTQRGPYGASECFALALAASQNLALADLLQYEYSYVHVHHLSPTPICHMHASLRLISASVLFDHLLRLDVRTLLEPLIG